MMSSLLRRSSWMEQMEAMEYWLYRSNDFFIQSLLDDPALLAWIFC
jgi:hypothetical protein